MNDQEQIKALAELDGWAYEPTHIEYEATEWSYGWFNPEHKRRMGVDLPRYLTSRDAIISVIEKNYPNLVARHLGEIVSKKNIHNSFTAAQIMCATPKQLAEALLRSNGKWKD